MDVHNTKIWLVNVLRESRPSDSLSIVDQAAEQLHANRFSEQLGVSVALGSSSVLIVES
jgi:hypothetical protein